MFPWLTLINVFFICAYGSAQYVEPAWYPRIEAEDTTGMVDRCQQKTGRDAAPTSGTRCSKIGKICYFGNQICPLVGPHPTLRCSCGAGTSPTWTCGAASCPSGVTPTSPPSQPTAPPVLETLVLGKASTPPPTSQAASTACPAAIPSTGGSCPVNGRTCTYTATSTNQTTACTTTNACTCSSAKWTCGLPKVNCTKAEPLVCPGSVPKPPAATTCGPRTGICNYTTTSTNSSSVCNTVDTCTCNGSSFSCSAPSTTCVPRPPMVCPASVPSSGSIACTRPGFICRYSQGSSNSTSICNTTNVCTCSTNGFLGCAAPVTTCIPATPANKCPEAPSPGGTCSVAGAGCTYTIVNQNATARCEEKTVCTCAQGLSYSCAKSVSCTPIDGTCPASQPTNGMTCQAQGLSCKYVAQSSNATKICNTTKVCTCGAGGFNCASPSVMCVDREAGTCPSTKPSTGASCGGSIGCTYTSNFSNSTASCTSMEKCTCSSNKFTCTAPATTCTPVTPPQCPSEPSDGLSCSARFGCSYTIGTSNQTTVCNTTKLCTCNGVSFSCATTGTTCAARAASCPLSRPTNGATCTISDSLECSYLSTVRNDTSTCSITNKCKCSSTKYNCVEANVNCTASGPLMCPGSIPSSGSVTCQPNGLVCTYTNPKNTSCDTTTGCTCTNGRFGCASPSLTCK